MWNLLFNMAEKEYKLNITEKIEKLPTRLNCGWLETEPWWLRGLIEAQKSAFLTLPPQWVRTPSSSDCFFWSKKGAVQRKSNGSNGDVYIVYI